MAGLIEISRKMSPQRPIKSMRELAKLHRWQGGEIGVGYTNRKIIERFKGMRNFLNFSRTNAYREALHKFDLLPNGVTKLPAQISIKSIINRHKEGKSIRFLSYNTYLLRAVIKNQRNELRIEQVGVNLEDIGGGGGFTPIVVGAGATVGAEIGSVAGPGGSIVGAVIGSAVGLFVSGREVIELKSKKNTQMRSKEIGKMIFRKYDIACLCEVFLDDDIWNNILRPWTDDSLTAVSAFENSGLRFLLRNSVGKLGNVLFRPFENEGGINDSDSMANKGMFMNIVNTGLGTIEIFSTHLFYGDTLLDIPLLNKITDVERSEIKIAEVNELKDFYIRHHNPENVAIIVGDFNIDGNANLNRNGNTDEHFREYKKLKDIMNSIGMYDLWVWDVYKRLPKAGFTSRLTEDDTGIDNDIDFLHCEQVKGIYNDQVIVDGVCNDQIIKEPRHSKLGEGRLDFVFIQRPEPSHTFNLDITTPQRLSFPFETNEEEKQFYLSDHMGIAFDIIVSKK